MAEFEMSENQFYLFMENRHADGSKSKSVREEQDALYVIMIPK